jgi:hypothetical protein
MRKKEMSANQGRKRILTVLGPRVEESVECASRTKTIGEQIWTRPFIGIRIWDGEISNAHTELAERIRELTTCSFNLAFLKQILTIIKEWQILRQ